MSALLPLEEAQRRLLALATPLATENVPITEAAGRWLAEDVAALRTQPAADLSAMDGYAIRFADLPGPWVVIGESAAGKGFSGGVGAGQAVRIFTGAPLPEDADTVVVQEDVTRDGGRLTLTRDGPKAIGQHVRPCGSDFAEGAPVAHAGDCLTPARLALLIMAGHASLLVRRRPRVAILSTGNELVPPGEPATGVAIPASNGAMLAAMIAPLGVDFVDFGIVGDDREQLQRAFSGLKDIDVLLTSGGASVGDHDLVKPALEATGAALDFWKVAIKPGKPLMAGRLGETLVLGLPGNPVSAFVTAHLFALPLVRHLAGSHDPLPTTIQTKLHGNLPATGKRAEFLRATFDGASVAPLTGQDSAALAMLAGANALIARPIGAAPAAPGEDVTIMPIA